MIQITLDDTYCKGCHLCIGECPKNVLAISKHRNARGYQTPEAAHPEACIKCLQCELICPDMTISVTGEPDEK